MTRTFRSWNLPLIAIVALVGLAMCCTGAFAQSGAGSIQGTVTDSTGAVIPGATIHVVNQATNITTNTTSSAVGFYQVPALFTGTYTVTVSAPGMKGYKTSVELLVAQNAIINPALTAGSVTQQVEVAADIVQLTTTDNGTIASTLENTRINQLPMNGRILINLASMTTPGLEGGGRANGLLGEALEYVADGVPISNRQFGGMNLGQTQAPDPDAVQEVRVETTNTGAQYSEPGTAIVTTKSGTNSLHGALFETARNNAIGIAKNRNNAYNYAAPHLVRNEFGASAGGPIIVPKVYNGKDKSFWFYAYERYSFASPTAELVPVPSVAWRNGDFSAYTNTSGVAQTLYDPATTHNDAACATPGAGGTTTYQANPYCRTQFNYGGVPNKINPARLAPTTKIIFDITQLPNTLDNPNTSTNLSVANPTFNVVPTHTFRLDHEFNEANRAYLRYTSNILTSISLRNYPVNSPATIAADGFPAQASGIAYNPSASFAEALGFTHVFSPTFFSETIVSQQALGQHNYAGGTPKADFEKMLGTPNNFGEPGFPSYGSQLVWPYGGTQFIYGLSQIVDNLDENMTKTVGKHQMQFGGRYRHERFGQLPDEGADQINFTNQTTGLYDTGTQLTNAGVLKNTGGVDVDAYLGSAYQYTVTQEPPYEHFHDMEIDGYFQDNYHWTRNLTVNVGARWEDHPAVWVKDGVYNSFDYKNDAMVLASPPAALIAKGYTTQTIITNMANIGVVYETPQQAGMPSALMKNYPFTFSPRVGVAYQPFGGKHGTVIRGAYGRYIYPMPTRSFVKNPMGNNPLVAGYSQNYNLAAQSPDGINNYLLRNAQPVVMGTNSANVVNSANTNAILPGVSLWSNSSSMPPDYVTQMNFTIEQPLKGNAAFRVTWLWSHGTNLDHYYYINNHPSQFVWEAAYGIAPPSGTTIGSNQYGATATGPYDQKTWGGNTWDIKNGWSNDNALQVTYQRLFHRGIAYQINYVWSKPLRVGGNYFRDSTVDPRANYMGVLGALGTVSALSTATGAAIAPALPPAGPSGTLPWQEYHALDKFEEYKVDTAIPKQHITFNGVVELPFGRGKHFLGGVNRLVDEAVGGWQIAGDGNIVSTDFGITSSNWGPTNPIKMYKHTQKITDCTSGVCHPEYLWFNGYFPVNQINAAVKGVSGLPSSYVAGQGASGAYSSPIDAINNNNNVGVTLIGGSAPITNAYAPGPIGSNPYSNTILNGPINYTVDLSIFKMFPITEKVALRFNLDAFNALNMMGYTNPNGTTGVETIQPGVGVASSANTPRQVQLTLRLQF